MVVVLKTLDGYIKPLGWDISKLAHEADISYHTAKKALDGEAIRPRSARAIAAALSKGTNQTVNVGDIRGLVIIQWTEK